MISSEYVLFGKSNKVEMRIELLSPTERGADPVNPGTASGASKTALTTVSMQQCKEADERETPVPLSPTPFPSDTTTVFVKCASTNPCSPVWSGVRIGRLPNWRPKVLSTYIPDRIKLNLKKISPRYVTMTHWDYDPTRNSTTSNEAMSLTQIVTSDPSISIFDRYPLINGSISSEDLSNTKEDPLDFEHPELLEFSTNDRGIFGHILFPVEPLSPVSERKLERTPVSDHEDQLENEEAHNLANNGDSCALGNKKPGKSILRPAKPVIIPQNAIGPTYFTDGSEIDVSSPRQLISQYDFRSLIYQDQYLGKLGSTKLTVRYCFPCRSIRLHLSGICSKCNRPHSVTNTEFLLPKAVERYGLSNYLLSDMTELLSSAATGLSEFAQPSSSDDDQVELRGHTNNHQDFPSNMIQQPPHELAKNETTDKVYATEYNDPVLSHLVKPDHADDIFLSSSTSGSMGSETDKRLGSSTYTRPKLPWALTNQQASGSPRGKILPFYPQQNTTVPHQHFQNYDGLPDTQNLISQLEKRTVLDKKQKDTDNHKERSLSNSPCGVTEDQEVANVMLGSAHTAGLNQRLLAMLQRRKNIQSIFETNQKMDTHNLLRTQPRRSAVVPSSARTQSQQPISRLSEGLNSERRRDSSLLTLRTTSQNRNLSSRKETKFPEKHSVQASIAKARTNSSQPHRVGDTPRSTSANTRVTFGDPPSMGGSSDGSKLSAIQTWQRRKTYDPHASSQPKTSKESIRSTNQSGRVGKSQDRISERLTNSAYQPTKNGQRTSRRLMNGLNRTAPVETADCLQALASIEAHTEFPAHCSVVPKILLQNQSQNRSEMVPATHQSKTRSETARKPTVTNAPSSVDGKRRQARSASSHSQYPSLMGQQRKNEPHICLTNDSRKTERSYQPLTNGHSRTGKHRTNLLHSDQMRSVSQAEYREFEETGPIPGVTACFDSNGKANLDNELHYPDLAVESIRYKIEKLANFIVRLRKRIERDYAEQGTCSPGDDVFGDEAVGATVAGMSTGMHPVVAASLKHLRVLEFNAQEIFNLLYPNEIDLWEPVRACLAGTIEGEQMYNEARSKLTDHASNSMNMDDIIKEGTIRRNETVAFDPDSYTSPDNNEYIPLHLTDIL